MSGKVAKKCVVCGLYSARVGDIKRNFMAKFPNNVDRCKKWVQRIGIEDLVYVPIEKLHQLRNVCGSHFQTKDFNRKKTRLKRSAVPSIRIINPPLSDEIMANFPCHMASAQPSISAEVNPEIPPVSVPIEGMTQESGLAMEDQPSTSSAENPSVAVPIEARAQECGLTTEDQPSTSSCGITVQREEMTPRKIKLIRKLKESRLTIRKLQKQTNLFNSIDSLALKTVISSCIQNRNKLPQGKRWSNTDKGLALSIYKKSPKAYRYLKNLLPMPSVRTLQTVLQKMPMEPGINYSLLNHLKEKTSNFKQQFLISAVLFDEMALKKRLIYNTCTDKVEGFEDYGGDERTNQIADHALVFMLQFGQSDSEKINM